MLEYSSDNVTLSGTTSDPLFFAATREHYPAMENSTYVWYVAYKIVNAANQNIESVVEGADAKTISCWVKIIFSAPTPSLIC